MSAPTLGGSRLALPEECFLLAHDEYDGRPLLPNQVLGLGVAAAQLAELVLANQIVISNGQALPAARRKEREQDAARVAEILVALNDRGITSPSEALAYIEHNTFHPVPPTAQQALAIVETEGDRRIAEYLAYLSQSTAPGVRTHLFASGVLQEHDSRVPRRRPRAYTREVGHVGRVQAVATAPLNRAEPLDARTAMLLSLVTATGIDAARPSVWWRLRGPDRESTRARIYQALGRPLTELADHVEAAVHDAVSAHP